jgi:hypothetical protein
MIKSPTEGRKSEEFEISVNGTDLQIELTKQEYRRYYVILMDEEELATIESRLQNSWKISFLGYDEQTFDNLPDAWRTVRDEIADYYLD